MSDKKRTPAERELAEKAGLVNQPDPVPNTSPSMHDLVAVDMMKRKEFGRNKYGTTLQANNGRDAVQDAYEEVLDLAVYLRQILAERDNAQADEIAKMHKKLEMVRADHEHAVEVAAKALGKKRGVWLVGNRTRSIHDVFTEESVICDRETDALRVANQAEWLKAYFLPFGENVGDVLWGDDE